MIVICTKCQAKFRIADEKIGPRGAKVRCSRCRTVFLVHPDLGTVPVDDASAARAPPAAPAAHAPLDVDLEPRAVAPPLENPFDANPVRASVPQPQPLPGVLAPSPALPAPDPFASASDADPFAAAGAPQAPSPGGVDPFSVPFPAAPDPFAPPARAADPFAAPARPYEGGPAAPGVPVTDLSDLLDAATPAAVRRPGAAGSPEPGVAELPPTAPPPFAPEDSGGLALEEPTDPPPLPPPLPAPAPASPDLGLDLGGAPFDASAGGDPFLGSAPMLDAGSFELSGPDGDPSLALAGEPAFASPGSKGATAMADAAPAPPAPPAPARPAGRPKMAPLAAPERIPGGRGSRLRAIGVNAVALAALLLIALAILLVWRSEGPLDAAALRPAAVLRALRGGAGGPFAAQEIGSGVYERERGPPVLFVRGRIVSRAPSAVRQVKIAVEIVRESEVIARGEALAGAVPTPEELWGSSDAASLAALARRAAARAPREVRPGDAVPFLVAIPDHPADLGGASLRVEVAAPGGSAP